MLPRCVHSGSGLPYSACHRAPQLYPPSLPSVREGCGIGPAPRYSFTDFFLFACYYHTTYKNKAPCALFHVFGCFCLKLGFFCHSFNIVRKFRPVLSPFIFKCPLTLLLSGGMAVGGFVTLHNNSGKHHQKSLFLVWCFIVSII